MTTPSALARSIKQLLRELLDRDLIILPNAMVAVDNRVTWRSPTPGHDFVDFYEHATIRTYRRWIESGEYSALLADGALLQLTYDLSHGEVVGHRLAFVPCPYRIDQDLLLTAPVSDVLDLYDSEGHDSITMQSAVRFDFDPRAAAEGHPSAHFTMNVSSCRLACEAPMTPESFIYFVYANFYRAEWLAHQEFFDSLPKNHLLSTVTDAERGQPHVAWRRLSAS